MDEAAFALLDWSEELELSVDELLGLLELDLLVLDLLELVLLLLAADEVCVWLPLEVFVFTRVNASVPRVSTSAMVSMVTRGDEVLRAGCTAGCGTAGCGTGPDCIAGAGCGCGTC